MLTRAGPDIISLLPSPPHHLFLPITCLILTWFSCTCMVNSSSFQQHIYQWHNLMCFAFAFRCTVASSVFSMRYWPASKHVKWNPGEIFLEAAQLAWNARSSLWNVVENYVGKKSGKGKLGLMPELLLLSKLPGSKSRVSDFRLIGGFGIMVKIASIRLQRAGMIWWVLMWANI